MSSFYQSELVRILPSGDPNGVYVPNVQSISTAFQIQRTDTMRLGRFAPMPYRHANQDPLVNVNMEFIPTGSNILATLGLMGTNSVVDNLVSGSQKYNNMKIQVRELVGGGSTVGTINLLSGVLTNYSFQATVGQTPKTSVALEFLDMGIDASTAVVPPTVDDAYPILRPQDITITLPTSLFGLNTVYPQSFNLSIPFGRTAINRIGSRKPVSRELSSPIMATFQVDAIIDSFASTTFVSGNNFFGLTCGAPLSSNLTVAVKQPNCTGESSVTLATYTFRKPYFDNFSVSNSVGGYTSVSLQFSCPVTMDNVAAESNVTIS